ncbi:MAG: hypothetical protein NTZ05_18685 [Chloroflexi bacterium]|nr:hypothetical protein [Chloroflexota bacterium]
MSRTPASLETTAPPRHIVRPQRVDAAATPSRPGAAPRRARRPRLPAAAAILSVTLHLPLVMLGIHLLSYDAPIHTFFASHYLRSPLALWEPRWYGGFSVASYPPLAQQTMALIAAVVGLDAAYPVLLLFTAAALPPAIYAWGRIWVGRRAAGLGAVIGAMAPCVGLTAFNFGQLPQLLGVTLALLTLAALNRWLRRGEPAALFLTAALAGATAAIHHLNFGLFLPPAGLALTAAAVLAGDIPRAALLRRALAAALLAAAAGILTVLPFWLWTLAYQQQAPIDHASRHNLLTDADAQRVFLWPMYGAWPLLAPALLLRAVPTWRRQTPLLILTALLAVIGLGGATGLPWLLYGRWADWLTYDRFSLWAAIAMTPLLGDALAGFLTRNAPLLQLRRTIAGLTLALGVLTFGWAATLHLEHPTQPAVLDLAPTQRFLDEDDHANWRYFTLGFGDQFARLSARTTARSIDGDYHTARSLPELRASGVGSLDGSRWWDPDGNTLRAVLTRGDYLGLRWVLTLDDHADGLLEDAGLTRFATLDNGVAVWERPGAPPISATTDYPPPEDWQAWWWAAAPGLAAASAAGCAIWLARRRNAEKQAI